MGGRLRMTAGLPPHPDPSPPVGGRGDPHESTLSFFWNPRPPPGGEGRVRGVPAVTVCLLAAALALSACGKKGDLEQREGVKPVYPRTYPTR